MKLVAIAAFLLAVVACAHPKPEIDKLPDSTASFTPAEIDFERFVSNCGASDPQSIPAFGAGQLYSLGLYGAGFPKTVLEVSFHSGIALGQGIAVTLMPWGETGSSTDASGTTIVMYGQAGTLATTSDSGTSFEWQQGANAAEVDAAQLASATISVDAMPAHEGDVGKLEFDIVFQDGGVLDLLVVQPVTSSVSGCPAG